MSTPALPPARRAVVPLLRIALVAQAVRLVIALVAGIAGTVQHAPGDGFGVGPLENGAQRLADFAQAGDGFGALLMLLAVFLLWASADVAALPQHRRRWRSDQAAASIVLALTAVSSVLLAAAYLWLGSTSNFFPAAEEIRLVGTSLVWAGALAGALYVTRGMGVAVPAGDAAADGDEAGAAVFAVDRKTGAVLAWTSMQDARENAPLFSVQDDEYDWYLDDGVVLAATAQGREVHLQPTPDERPEELLGHLTAYAERRGLVVDEPDEPLAYVEPIARDHYLEMWPGWLRWVGRLAR